MALQRYFPPTEPAQIAWLSNYKLKIPVHGTTCGVSAELTDTDKDLAFYIWILETWNPAIQNDAKEATAYKKLIGQSPATGVPPAAIPPPSTFVSPPALVPPGVLKRLFNQVARIKMHASYTAAIGEDLQIIGQEDSAEHLVPAFSVKVQDGTLQQSALIKFVKFGHDGVYIESRVNGGAWEFLSIDTKTPYLDDEPLHVAHTPETREYRMRFWDAGEANGDWTPVVKVTVGA